jgi:hypothetical protein
MVLARVPPTSRGQTFIYLSGHIFSRGLSNQVPIKEQALLVNVLSISGLLQPQGLTKPKLPRRRVMPRGHNLQSPITQLTDRRPHNATPEVRVLIRCNFASPAIVWAKPK